MTSLDFKDPVVFFMMRHKMSEITNRLPKMRINSLYANVSVAL